MEHITTCVEIGEKVSREYGIENILAKMKQEWEKVDFELVKYKTSNTYTILGFDDIEQILDEHLSNTQMILVSPFKKPFENEIDEWFSQLVLMSNTLEEWARFQAQWCYLQPIFDSPDIIKQLPNESTMFKRVDANWRHMMNQTRIQKNVLKVCTSEGILEKSRESNNNLEKIQKELNNYLELK